MPALLTPVLEGFQDKDRKVQLAACDAMFNMIKICKEAILQCSQFLRVFDEVVNLITSVNEVREWAIKVDEQIKDIVYGAITKGSPFDLDGLLN